MVSDSQQARLRYASQLLVHSGSDSIALRAGLRQDTWNEGLAQRIIAEVWDKRGHLATLGMDPTFLPKPTSTPAVTAPAVIPAPAVPQQRQPVFSPVALLDSQQGDALQFDGTLDGLRGVPLSELSGLGSKQLSRLSSSGMDTVFDLMMRVPLRYIDRRDLHNLADLHVGMNQVATTGTVLSVTADAAKRMARILIGDGPTRLPLVFFGAPWQAKRFTEGDGVLLQGDVTEWRGKPQMVFPLIEPLGDASAPVLPVYPQSAKHQVSTWLIGRAALQALARISTLSDPVPDEWRRECALSDRHTALRAVHVPESIEEAQQGRQRMAYDELLRLQLALGVRRSAQQAQPAVTHQPTGELTTQLHAELPYPPTGAQQRAITAITGDLTAHVPMNRLLQGDVGSGKTLVSVAALLSAVEGGHQAVLMAPTEILTTQHHAEIQRLVEPLGLQVGLLTSRARSKARRETLAALQQHRLSLVVGTHALLSDEVEFASLGLVVIDEQHRFGVEQRSQLLGKGTGGAMPDLLVATATPIPRTAAMTAFGDLDVTVLDELPPGRSPIATRWEPDITLDGSGARQCPWDLIHDQVALGRQAYVVCPLVEESEKAQAAAAENTATQLRTGALSGLRIGVVTGRQKATERGEVMRQFAAGDLDVLVATTVIEVGVNVPNATVIAILDAPRFGLAQLHQLRGRVGRGQHAGHCVLTGTANDTGTARMEAMCATTDGFALSETDLTLRGPGALAGRAQAGHRAGLLVADLIDDADLMHTARTHAQQLLSTDPFLQRRPGLRNEVETALGDDADWLLKS